jgi:hypothetical protein
MPSSNNKRPGGSDDGDHNGDSPNKVARLDLNHDHQQQYNGHDGGDYNSQNGSNNTSGGKKKGGGGSTRTGQACDRCKVRIVSHWHIQTVSTDSASLTDPQDTMRCAPRWLLAMPSKQQRMQDHR